MLQPPYRGLRTNELILCSRERRQAGRRKGPERACEVDPWRASGRAGCAQTGRSGALSAFDEGPAAGSNDVR
jgi:hypothetical protein